MFIFLKAFVDSFAIAKLLEATESKSRDLQLDALGCLKTIVETFSAYSINAIL